MKKYIDMFTKNRSVRIGIVVAVMAMLLVAVGLTVAYLGDGSSKKNTVNVGYGDVAIAEEFSAPNELAMENSIDKNVKIQNKSSVPAFVRVYAEFTDSSLAEHAQVTYDKNTYSWAEFKEKLGTDIISKWTYVSEEEDSGLGGYFYYTEALPIDNAETEDVVEGVTDELFEAVYIDYSRYDDDGNVVDDSNINRIQPLEMVIYTELVQTAETGTKTVTTPKEDEDGHMVDKEESVYGYRYDNSNEWAEAWRSFLKIKEETP